VHDAHKRLAMLVALVMLAYAGAAAAAGQDETSLKTAGVKGPALSSGQLPFVGKFNGFEFYDITKAPLEDPNACSADQREELFESDLRATGLDFTATYLPKGTILVSAGGQKCPEAVLQIQKDYELPNGEMLTIALIEAPRRIPGTAPKSQLRGVYLRGRPAVLNSSLSQFNSGELHMSDGSGSTGFYYISGLDLKEGELLKIGQGIVKR
jgi:hypothetical protein